MKLRQRAANTINNWWKYSTGWDKKAKKYNCSWEEIALQDCNKRIYDLEDEKNNLEDVRNELELRINLNNS